MLPHVAGRMVTEERSMGQERSNRFQNRIDYIIKGPHMREKKLGTILGTRHVFSFVLHNDSRDHTLSPHLWIKRADALLCQDT